MFLQKQFQSSDVREGSVFFVVEFENVQVLTSQKHKTQHTSRIVHPTLLQYQERTKQLQELESDSFPTCKCTYGVLTTSQAEMDPWQSGAWVTRISGVSCWQAIGFVHVDIVLWEDKTDYLLGKIHIWDSFLSDG